DPGAIQIAKNQRANAQRIAATDHLLRSQRYQRECAFKLTHGLDEAGVDVLLAAEGDQVKDRLRVGGRGENRALLRQGALHRHCVGEVAVMSNGDAAIGKLGKERLNIACPSSTGRGVSGVSDGTLPFKAIEDCL